MKSPLTMELRSKVMAKDNDNTPVPAAAQAKMRQGVRQRYAMATTESANPQGERKR